MDLLGSEYSSTAEDDDESGVYFIIYGYLVVDVGKIFKQIFKLRQLTKNVKNKQVLLCNLKNIKNNKNSYNCQHNVMRHIVKYEYLVHGG